WKHAEQHYRHPDGLPTSELNDFRLSLRPLKELYGHTRAAEFGPLSTWPGLRTMFHDPHPTRRRPSLGTARAAASRTHAGRTRPPGDGAALLRRLVAPSHCRAPRLLPPDGPQGAARLPQPRVDRPVPRQAWPGPRRCPTLPRHPPADRPAPPGTDVYQLATHRGRS